MYINTNVKYTSSLAQTMQLQKPQGVWGIGATGCAIMRYAVRHRIPVIACDSCTPSPETRLFLRRNNIPFYLDRGPRDRNAFFSACSQVIPSPGINLRACHDIPHLVSEVDAFLHNWHKPYIGITGSVGKTTLTRTLEHLLKSAGYAVGCGGNIGTPLFNLLDTQYDIGVFELSSFQLEHTRHCNPSIAILTNIYPNHLDRHATLEAYKQAKYNLFRNQSAHHIAILPLSHAHEAHALCQAETVHYIASSPSPDANDKALYERAQRRGNIWHTDSRGAICKNGVPQNAPHLTRFTETNLILAAVCAHLSLSVPKKFSLQLSHRCEHIATHKGLTFINDSKATVMAATTAAVAAHATSRPVLLLGGTSKGTNRSHDIQTLAHHAYYVVCFGSEARDLHAMCQKYNIPSSAHDTLESAFHTALQVAPHESTILLSPGGASFDLFANYKQRGDHFRALVGAYIQADI